MGDFFQNIAYFCEHITALEARAAQASPSEMKFRFNEILARYQRESGLSTPAEYDFFSVFDYVRPIHTELCLVRFEPDRVRLSFHEDWHGHYSVTAMVRRSACILHLIERMRRQGAGEGAAFMCELGDNGEFPSLSFSSRHDRACPVPDPDFFESHGYEVLRHEIDTHFIPWEAREAKAFWRGSSTGLRRFAPPPEGTPEGEDDFSWLSRLSLCAKARHSPHRAFYDVGLTAIVHMPEPHLVARINRADFLRPPVPRLDFMRHKGIIVIDGHANAWSALFAALLMGSCVLKVCSERGYRQWYYDYLRPFEHYVPIAADLSDLDEALAWLLAHDAKARAIGEAGRDLARAITFEAAMDESAARILRWLPKARFWEARA